MRKIKISYICKICQEKNKIF